MQTISRISWVQASYLLLILVFSSCDRTPKQVSEDLTPADTSAHGILICNEGNFQWGNASLSFYNTGTGNLQEDVFKSVNQQSIGDVLQSICISNGLAYLVVNNSGKIEIIDTKTFESKGKITGFNSPRYFLPIDANKAYVSDLYEKAVYVVQPSTKTIVSKIAINSWTEEMVYVNQQVYVCGRTSSYVYKINPATNTLSDSIYIGYGAQNITVDANQKIWVLSVGKDAIPAQLHRISAAGVLEKSFTFTQGSVPNKLMTNPAKTTLYFLNQHIYQMDILAGELPVNALVQAKGRTFYSMGYDARKKEIILSDAKDYLQKSEIYRIDSSGNELGHFKAGIISSNFGFK